jgi:hypothetical protein
LFMSKDVLPRLNNPARLRAIVTALFAMIY